MDILISSNLERLLYLLSGRDGAAVQQWMAQLEKEKRYEVSSAVKEGLGCFYGGFCTQEETEEAIGDMYRNHDYLLDTHTAVAYKVYADYVKETGDETPALIASTASPYKFAESVGRAVGLADAADGFEAVRQLEKATGVKVQKGLKDLDKKPVLHKDVCEIDGLADAVLSGL
jgi:threonine synthase